MEEIKKIRSKIDKIDEKIFHLLSDRFLLTNQIGKIKKSLKIQNILDQNRWKEIQSKNIDRAKKFSLNSDLIMQIYEIIHHFSIKEQENS